MNGEKINREHLETKIPLGQFSIELQDVDPLWLDETHQQKAINELKQVYDELLDSMNLTPLYFLKLVVITSKMSSTVDFWAKELGRKDKITVHTHGYVGGKMLFWGDGTAENSFAIVIINEEQAWSLLDEGNEFLGRYLFAHELGHIVTEYSQKKLYEGHKLDALSYSCHLLSHSIWSEYFSDLLGSMFYSDIAWSNQINDMFFKLTDETIILIEQEILKYRLHNNIDQLFSFVMDKLGLILSQLGRCLGTLEKLSNEDTLVDDFFNKMLGLSKEWKAVSEKAFELLGEGVSTRESYEALNEVVIKYYHCLGLFPELLPDGNLWISVP